MNNVLRNNKLADYWIFEALTRPEVTPGFFANRKVGEHINVSTGKPYRERITVARGKRIFVQGR